MVYFIEELIDEVGVQELEQLVYKLMGLSKEDLIKELANISNISAIDLKFKLGTEDHFSLCTKFLEYKYHLFDDPENHAWNKKVVINLIAKKPITHWYDNEKY